MEHICFEFQLCIKISIFKGIWNIDILINLCLGTSLYFVFFSLELSQVGCVCASVWENLVGTFAALSKMT